MGVVSDAEEEDAAMDETDRDSERVDGGRVEVWLRKDGLFGVTLLPDEGQPGYPGISFTSGDPPDGFPESYDRGELKAWGRAHWEKCSGDSTSR